MVAVFEKMMVTIDISASFPAHDKKRSEITLCIGRYVLGKDLLGIGAPVRLPSQSYR